MTDRNKIMDDIFGPASAAPAVPSGRDAVMETMFGEAENMNALDTNTRAALRSTTSMRGTPGRSTGLGGLVLPSRKRRNHMAL